MLLHHRDNGIKIPKVWIPIVKKLNNWRMARWWTVEEATSFQNTEGSKDKKLAQPTPYAIGVRQPLVTLFGQFTKSWKVPSHQLNSKTNDLVLLSKTIWKYWNCFLSPVAMDGTDRNELKFENIGQFFQVLMPWVTRNLLWLALW